MLPGESRPTIYYFKYHLAKDAAAHIIEMCPGVRGYGLV